MRLDEKAYCPQSNPISPDSKDTVWQLQSQHLNWVRSRTHINLITITTSKSKLN